MVLWSLGRGSSRTVGALYGKNHGLCSLGKSSVVPAGESVQAGPLSGALRWTGWIGSSLPWRSSRCLRSLMWNGIPGSTCWWCSHMCDRTWTWWWERDLHSFRERREYEEQVKHSDRMREHELLMIWVFLCYTSLLCDIAYSQGISHPSYVILWYTVLYLDNLSRIHGNMAMTYRWRPAHHPETVHLQSQETGKENHCRPLTPWT